MIKKQKRGITLVELSSALGLAAVMMSISAQDASIYNEQSMGKSIGLNIAQFDRSVGHYISHNSSNPEDAVGIKHGFSWLEGADCGGGASREYLSCASFEKGFLERNLGQPSTSIYINSDGNLASETIWQINGNQGSARIGIAALTANSILSKERFGDHGSKVIYCPLGLDGGAIPSGEYCSGASGQLVSYYEHYGSEDPWLRTDHKNTMLSFLEFSGSGEPSEQELLLGVDSSSHRQIVNVARLYNNEIGESGIGSLVLGNVMGDGVASDTFSLANSLLSDAILTDGNMGVMERLLVKSMANIGGNAEVDENIAGGMEMDISSNVSSIQGNIIARTDGEYGGDIGASKFITANLDVIAGNDVLGHDFYAGRHASSGIDFYSRDSVISRRGAIDSKGGYIGSGDMSLFSDDDKGAGDLAASGEIISRGSILSRSFIEGGEIKSRRGVGVGILSEEDKERIMDSPDLLVGSKLMAGERLVAREHLEIINYVSHGDLCDRDGLISRSESGVLLTCQDGSWGNQMNYDDAPFENFSKADFSLTTGCHYHFAYDCNRVIYNATVPEGRARTLIASVNGMTLKGTGLHDIEVFAVINGFICSSQREATDNLSVTSSRKAFGSTMCSRVLEPGTYEVSLEFVSRSKAYDDPNVDVQGGVVLTY